MTKPFVSIEWLTLMMDTKKKQTKRRTKTVSCVFPMNWFQNYEENLINKHEQQNWKKNKWDSNLHFNDWTVHSTVYTAKQSAHTSTPFSSR